MTSMSNVYNLKDLESLRNVKLLAIIRVLASNYCAITQLVNFAHTYLGYIGFTLSNDLIEIVGNHGVQTTSQIERLTNPNIVCSSKKKKKDNNCPFRY